MGAPPTAAPQRLRCLCARVGLDDARSTSPPQPPPSGRVVHIDMVTPSDKPRVGQAFRVNTTLTALPEIPLWRTIDLQRQGMDSRRITRLIDAGKILRVRRGCYVPAQAWNQLASEQQGLLSIVIHHHASLPYASGTLVYSHTSAARLHGLRLWKADERIHLTQPFKASRGGNAADVVPHTAQLQPGTVTEKYGLPVSTLEQTVVDCSRTLRYESALIVAEHALLLGANRQVMLSAAHELRGHKNVGNTRLVLESASALSESAGETRTLDFLRRMRIPLPIQQVEVRTQHGLHRLDFAWEECKLALEFDGKTKYFDYGPTDEAIFQERRREKALMADGWTIVRIEWSDLAKEAALKRRILTALHSARLRTNESVA